MLFVVLIAAILADAKLHPNLPPRSLDAYHLLHFPETTSFSNHPVYGSSALSEEQSLRSEAH